MGLAMSSGEGRRPPLLMPQDEVISLKRAVADTGKSPDTIRGYHRDFGIARQTRPNAPLEISAVALQMVLHGDTDALDLLRAGERSHARVLTYRRLVGLPD